MNKRKFLGAAAVGALALRGAAAASRQSTTAGQAAGPALLTVTGKVGNPNRGPLDPALDQMMKKQGIAFERAHAFDFAALIALPAQRIAPTLEYDGKVHALTGPLLTDVLQAAGAVLEADTKIVLRAVDGYAIGVPLAEVRRLRFIVATHLDRRPMPLGGLGPLWAVVDADRIPELAARPVDQRFALCPWGLYHIEVQ